MPKLLFALLLSVLFASVVARHAWAQEPYAYVSTDSITVGDRFGLIIVVPKPTDAQIARPIFSAPNGASTVRFGDLIIFKSLSSGRKDLASGGYEIADTLVYEASTFALDTAFVPPLRLRLVSNNDTTAVATSSFTFPVVSLAEEGMEDIIDIAPIVSFPAPIWPWLLLAALAVGIFFLFKYRDKLRIERDDVEEIEPEIPRDPPFEEAMLRFDAMQEFEFSDERVKEFFVELTNITRVYLSRRVDIPALESTSSELLSDLSRWQQRDSIDIPFDKHLSSVLETADLAKFADSHPAEQLSREALFKSRELITQIEDVVRESEIVAADETVSDDAEDDGRIGATADSSMPDARREPEQSDGVPEDVA